MSYRPLDNRWIKHLTDKNDKARFEEAVRHDTLVLGRLLAILKEEYNTLERQEESEAQFDNPNWEALTAYRSGLRSQIKRVMTLLNFLED